MTYNTLVVLSGVGLLGVCCGLVGSFAVLRRRALMGDALAHAALPGVCLAFLVLRERSLPAMLLGGFLTGLLGVAAVAALRAGTRIKEDAGIGIVLSVFYAAGIALSGWIQRQPALGSKAGLETYFLGKTSGMLIGDVVLIGGTAVGCLLLILILYKEFQLVAFDPSFASVQGWPAFRIDLLLMAMIAVTVIIGLPAVGVVLMAALLIVPAAAARFWTDRLGPMLAVSAAFGLAIGVLGTLVTARANLPSGPVIVLAGSAIFLISMLAAPRRGLLAKTWTQRAFRRRIAAQAILCRLSEGSPAAPEPALPEGDESAGFAPAAWTHTAGELQAKVTGARALRAALGELERRGDLERHAGGWRLTSLGRQRGARLLRARRLWESFLCQHAETAGQFADLDLESLEERLPPEILRELEEQPA